MGPGFVGHKVWQRVLGGFCVERLLSFNKFWAASICAGMEVSFARNTVKGLVGSATGRSVSFGAGATCVCRSLAVFGEVAPVLAFEASDGFLLVLVGVESFHVDVESMADGCIGCLRGSQGD